MPEDFRIIFIADGPGHRFAAGPEGHVEHERDDACQDERDYDDNETPDAGLIFISGQPRQRGLVLVEQFASPKQGLRGNLDSLV